MKKLYKLSLAVMLVAIASATIIGMNNSVLKHFHTPVQTFSPVSDPEHAVRITVPENDKGYFIGEPTILPNAVIPTPPILVAPVEGDASIVLTTPETPTIVPTTPQVPQVVDSRRSCPQGMFTLVWSDGSVSQSDKDPLNKDHSNESTACPS